MSDCDESDFCNEFLAKMTSPELYCLPTKGVSKTMSCLGYHYGACADRVVASLYSVYCFASVGKATAEEISVARVALRGIESVDDPGFTKIPGSQSAAGCFVSNCGLEFYVGSLNGMEVWYQNLVRPLSCIRSSGEGWDTKEADREPFWVDPSMVVVIPHTYEFKTVSVGNFVYARRSSKSKRDKLRRTSVDIQLCKNVNDIWIEYVDRVGRLYRFNGICDTTDQRSVLSSYRFSCSPINVIVTDALGAGNTDVHLPRSDPKLDVSVASFAACTHVKKAALGRERVEDLVVAVMPPIMDDEVYEYCNGAILKGSCAHLSAATAVASAVASAAAGSHNKRSRMEE